MQVGQVGERQDTRRTFTDIMPSSFVWRGEELDRISGKWKLRAEFRAARRGSVSHAAALKKE